MKIFILIFILGLFGLPSLSKAQQCRTLFGPPQTLDRSTRLFAHHDQEVQNLSEQEVKELNDRFLFDLDGFKPPPSSRRAISITYRLAEKILDLMRNNDVISYASNERYSSPDVEIGYCFGRATFAHILLLKMGLQKESIFKIWAVGPMAAYGIDWGFHVATVVYTRDRGWLVIDTNSNHPQTVAEWMQTYGPQSSDKKLRFYLTDASKFSADLNRYDRTQLGLNVERGNDAYRGYFKDMMRFFSSNSLDKMGLPKLTSDDEQNKGVTGFFEHLFY